MSDITFMAEGEDNVYEMIDLVHEEIDAALRILTVAGRAPAPWFRIDTAVQTLVQFLFDEPETIAQFQLALAVNTRNKLQAAIDHASQPQLETP